MAGQERAPVLVDAFPDSVAAGSVLRSRRWRVAVAESCTGGLLGAVLTAIAGSSDYFVGGVIAYDNAVKTALLGVDAGLLADHGAVSQPVAEAMARGARARLGADVGVAITGVAGPGDDSGKPAGLVFVALDGAGIARVRRLEGDHGREGNRAAAVRAALTLMVELA